MHLDREFMIKETSIGYYTLIIAHHLYDKDASFDIVEISFKTDVTQL